MSDKSPEQPMMKSCDSSIITGKNKTVTEATETTGGKHQTNSS